MDECSSRGQVLDLTRQRQEFPLSRLDPSDGNSRINSPRLQARLDDGQRSDGAAFTDHATGQDDTICANDYVFLQDYLALFTASQLDRDGRVGQFFATVVVTR